MRTVTLLDSDVGVGKGRVGFAIEIGYVPNPDDGDEAVISRQHAVLLSAAAGLALLDYLTERRDELQEAADDDERYQVARTELEARNG